MDNVDKMSKDEQLAVFQLSLWFMEFSRAFVVLNLRDDTYERFKNEPPLDTYRSGITFHVEPPRFIDVVRRRLELSTRYLENELEDRLSYETKGGRVTYPKELVGEFLDKIYTEIFNTHKNIGRLIQGLAGRDVRRALEIFEKILRSGHLSEEHITRRVTGRGEFELGEDLILKAVMRGDYRFHSETSGFVANVLYCSSAWVRPTNFLVPDILFWLYKNRKIPGQLGLEGYFSVRFVARELELAGYVADDVSAAVDYCLRENLLEADHFGRRLTSKEDNIKVTYSGFIHLRFLVDRIEYLYGILPATPVFIPREGKAIAEILERELRDGDVTIQMKAQAVEALFRHLKELYTSGVASFPAFGRAGSGASYVLDSVERAFRSVRTNGSDPPPNPLDTL